MDGESDEDDGSRSYGGSSYNSQSGSGQDSEINDIYNEEEDLDEDEYGRKGSMAENDDDDMNDEANALRLAKDRVWLDDFISDKLKKSIVRVEQEVDNIRNKKVRGAVKKQKDMLKALNDKLKLMRAIRMQCEELAMTIGFLEGGDIRNLKLHLRKYNEDVDNETLRSNVDNEVKALIEKAD